MDPQGPFPGAPLPTTPWLDRPGQDDGPPDTGRHNGGGHRNGGRHTPVDQGNGGPANGSGRRRRAEPADESPDEIPRWAAGPGDPNGINGTGGRRRAREASEPGPPPFSDGRGGGRPPRVPGSSDLPPDSGHVRRPERVNGAPGTNGAAAADRTGGRRRAATISDTDSSRGVTASGRHAPRPPAERTPPPHHPPPHGPPPGTPYVPPQGRRALREPGGAPPPLRERRPDPREQRDPRLAPQGGPGTRGPRPVGVDALNVEAPNVEARNVEARNVETLHGRPGAERNGRPGAEPATQRVATTPRVSRTGGTRAVPSRTSDTGAHDALTEALPEVGGEPGRHRRRAGTSPESRPAAEYKEEAEAGGRRTRSGGRRRRPTFWKELPILIVVALALTFLIQTFLAKVYVIPSGSMETTLHGCDGCQNDRVLVDKITFRFSDPQPGDVVVFEGPPSWSSEFKVEQPSNPVVRVLQQIGSLVGLAPPDEKDFVKRVIAVPGQVVQCCDTKGRVVVDGQPLNEPYIYYKPENGPPRQKPFSPVTVPAGQLWMMGDSRNNSADSREPGHGPIPIANVIGKARLIVLPFARFGWIAAVDPHSAAVGMGPAGMGAAGAAGAPLALGLFGTLPLAWGRRRRQLRNELAEFLPGHSQR